MSCVSQYSIACYMYANSSVIKCVVSLVLQLYLVSPQSPTEFYINEMTEVQSYWPASAPVNIPNIDMFSHKETAQLTTINIQLQSVL